MKETDVRELRIRLRAASAEIDRIYELLPEIPKSPSELFWGIGWRPRWDLGKARRYLRIAEQSLAKADDPRLPHLAPPKRIRASRGSS